MDSVSNASLDDILASEDLATVDSGIHVIANLHDALFNANLVMLLVFDATNVAEVVFQGAYSAFDWFQINNVFSSSLWDLSPAASSNAEIGIQNNRFKFELSSADRTKFYFQLDCKETRQCRVLFTPTGNPVDPAVMKEAWQFHLYVADFNVYWVF